MVRALVLACVMHAATAFANPVVVVATDDPAFEAALRDTLAVQSLRVVAIAGATTTDALAIRSRELVQRETADVVVWLIPDPVAVTLAAYDREHDQLLVRTLSSGSPLDAMAAAEAARATRTMLRALRSAPRRPRAVVLASIPPPDAPPPRETPGRRLLAAASIGIRASGELELGGAAVWRPDRVGLALMVGLSRFELASPMFDGRIADDSVALVARLPLRVAPRWGVAAIAGIAIHSTALAGRLESGATVSDLRFDPAVRVGAGATYAIDPRVEVGLGLATDTMLQRARYVVRSGEIALVPRIQVAGLMTIAVAIR